MRCSRTSHAVSVTRRGDGENGRNALRGLVEKLQAGQRRPRLRQTNFWISDELNERLALAASHFGAGSKSHLVRVLLEDALDRLARDVGEGSSPCAWTVEIATEHEMARLLVLSDGKAEALNLLEEWLDGQPAGEFDVDAMRPHDGAQILFLERRSRTQ